jgi:hypothetical protein
MVQEAKAKPATAHHIAGDTMPHKSNAYYPNVHAESPSGKNLYPVTTVQRAAPEGPD